MIDALDGIIYMGGFTLLHIIFNKEPTITNCVAYILGISIGGIIKEIIQRFRRKNNESN